MREFFENWNPQGATLTMFKQILNIVESYQAQGFKLTLRQLYYQLVTRDLIPNQDKSYKRIGDIVCKARLGGLLDWDAIEDRVRRPQRASEFESLRDLVNAAVYSYRLPRLQGQPTYVELWVEKDALAGVLWPLASRFHVVLMVNRGYSSASAMKDAGDRIRANVKRYGCKRAHVLYLGDLDPSGEDMVRDIRDRLQLFINQGWLVDTSKPDPLENGDDRAKRKPFIRFTVEKLALTPEQVEEHNPPPNPAKMSDSRATKFVEEHGYSSYEVDALPPAVLRDIIVERLDQLIDGTLVDSIKRRERRGSNALRTLCEGINDHSDDQDDDDDADDEVEDASDEDDNDDE